MSETKSTKPKRKALWALLKESMNKASSGCGPGCGCHVQKRDAAGKEAAPAEDR